MNKQIFFITVLLINSLNIACSSKKTIDEERKNHLLYCLDENKSLEENFKDAVKANIRERVESCLAIEKFWHNKKNPGVSFQSKLVDDVDMSSSYNISPLHYALIQYALIQWHNSRSPSLKMVQTLINGGANVNKPGFNQLSPLMSAYICKNYNGAEILINSGALVNQQYYKHSSESFFDWRNLDDIQHACKNGNTALHMLVSLDVIYDKATSQSPINSNNIEQDLAHVHKLLSAGQDLTITNTDGQTALDLAKIKAKRNQNFVVANFLQDAQDQQQKKLHKAKLACVHDELKKRF